MKKYIALLLTLSLLFVFVGCANEKDIRPEFKKAVDEYEKFFEEYCELVTKLESDPNDKELLLAYNDYMKQYVTTMQEFEALGNEEMNEAETEYYLKAQARITKMLAEKSIEIE